MVTDLTYHMPRARAVAVCATLMARARDFEDDGDAVEATRVAGASGGEGHDKGGGGLPGLVVPRREV